MCSLTVYNTITVLIRINLFNSNVIDIIIGMLECFYFRRFWFFYWYPFGVVILIKVSNGNKFLISFSRVNFTNLVPAKKSLVYSIVFSSNQVFWCVNDSRFARRSFLRKISSDIITSIFRRFSQRNLKLNTIF